MCSRCTGFQSEPISSMTSSNDLQGDIFNVPLHQNMFTVPVVLMLSPVHFRLNKREQSFVQRLLAVKPLMKLLFSKSLVSALLRTKYMQLYCACFFLNCYSPYGFLFMKYSLEKNQTVSCG